MTRRKTAFQVTSTTGCSCVLLSGNIKSDSGKPLLVKTINSWAGIRLCKGADSDVIDSVIEKKYLLASWRKINVLIIDEVSMMSCKVFTVIESIARLARGSSRPFGGIQVVFVGDFLQLPPIADPSDAASGMFAFQAPRWLDVVSRTNHIELTTIFRQNDNVFREILNEIRMDNLSEKNKTILEGRVGVRYSAEEHNGIMPIRIMSTRMEVRRENSIQYNLVTGKEFVFESAYSTTRKTYTENDAVFTFEDAKKCAYICAANSHSQSQMEMEIANLKNSVPVEETIELKKGVPVMILVNLDIEHSISNGTLGVVAEISSNNVVTVLFKNGITRQILPYVWQNAQYPCICVSQLPLTLAYASSIHKQQGATIEMARINLGKSIFEDSQIYVALSRVTSLEGLYLDAFDATKIKINQLVKEFYLQFPTIDASWQEQEQEQELELAQEQDQERARVLPRTELESTENIIVLSERK
jgi:ATP-dependent exoDNAse (exonuclease V) alpha subunit